MYVYIGCRIRTHLLSHIKNKMSCRSIQQTVVSINILQSSALENMLEKYE